MSKRYTKFSTAHVDKVFEQVEKSGIKDAFLGSPDDTLRQARLVEGIVFNFVANADLVKVRTATIKGNPVVITEMLDKDNNPISVTHLLRRRNGLEQLFDPDGDVTTSREGLTQLWKSISKAGNDGIAIRVDNVDRYPAGHERADQIRMVKFSQVEKE